MKRKLFCGIAAASIIAASFTVAEAQQRRTRRSSVRRSSVAAQKASATSTQMPLLGGWMINNKIEARTSDLKTGFNFNITGAQVVGDQLQLQGELMPIRAGGKASTATATLVSTMARTRRHPWERVYAEPGRTRNNRNTPRPNADTGTSAEAPPQGGTAAVASVPPSGVQRTPEVTSNIGQLSQATQSTARATPTPVPEGEPTTSSGAELNEQTQSLYTPADAGSGCDTIYLKMSMPGGLPATRTAASQDVQLNVVLAPRDNKIGEEINSQMCRIVRAIKDKEATETHLAALNQMLKAGSR